MKSDQGGDDSLSGTYRIYSLADSRVGVEGCGRWEEPQTQPSFVYNCNTRAGAVHCQQ